MNFYNPNEKIRLMRKRFNMNQADLEDANMTRAFISMMESGKRNVSKASSKILTSKFNAKAIEFGVDISLDDEYFYRKPQEDARFYCNNELLKDNTHEQLEELIEIAKEFELDDILAEIYKLNADKYFLEANFIDAFINYSNCLGKYKELKNIKEQLYIYNSLGICKAKRSEHEEAIFYYNQAIVYAKEENDTNYFLKASFNLALAYSYLKKYEECIELLEKNIFTSNIPVTEDVIINAKVLKANMLYNMGKKDEVLKEYIDIIASAEDKESNLMGVVYNNLALFYCDSDNFEESLKYISYSQKIKNKVDKTTLSNVLNTKARLFLKQGHYDQSIMLFELAISLAEQYKNFLSLIQNYMELIKALELSQDLEKLEYTIISFINFLEEHEISEGRNYALSKLAETFVKQKKNEQAIKTLHKLSNILIEV
ncbi:helix-turn-helix transcriptional regulator [Clostridium manihotivorum]|uniref:HTH cro/C1-type domain-containing protein n=1 Tax=Clostridium manihotivorum TaxID=2320868 RepID=A0A410DXN0_9CLOT|nr:helix-turn-helix transcriptional regulator [Clostridium manihotivorum]QAA33847.1 hypothetical protein C1I91_20650 [Clostridium manihotivorum]